MQVARFGWGNGLESDIIGGTGTRLSMLCGLIHATA